MKKKLFFLIVSLFFSCSEENSDQSPLLERLNDIVWTRGTNFKIFKSNPFRLILVEDGVCLEFTENPKDIRGNEFQYTLLESGTFFVPIRSSLDLFFFEVKAVDDQGNIDSTASKLILPIKNSAPEIQFRYRSNS